MIITKIDQQRNNKKRYSIFIDGKFAFGISDVDLLYYKLKEFDNISQEKYESILNEVIFIKARELAYRYLSYKLRTRKEVRDRLLKEDFGNETIERVIKLIESYGYIDDEKYAIYYIKDRVELKGLGKDRIFHELKERGVSLETARKVISEYPFDEFSDCLKHLEKKLRGNSIEDIKEKQKCINYLLRRGFSFSIIEKALKQYVSE